MRPDTSRLILLSLVFTLASCGGNKTRDDGPGSGRIPDLPGNAIPRDEPRSKYGNGRDLGNGPQYEVFNTTYTVMPSSAGYQERGVASWYGKKFHGNLTSNREVYDMYEMTAAHKTLPLPTYVRVTNLRNNQSIVVRVNDRGPFVNNRIIDLSYAAALKLDMVRDGTSLVEVTAINFDKPAGTQQGGDRPTSSRQPPKPSIVSTPAVSTNRIYVQVGAFGERENAARRLAKLSQSGITDAFIHEDVSTNTTLYRVRIGPVADVVQYDLLVEELEAIGINDPYLITE
ncbi:MAG: septal ring lytic transglycosylase RlpA family protein [Gammaproteobacteria bacterium]|nr:septal ring lytic transglycosylase RlpA family protein [Gammaproteobacteria bacterium]